MMGRSEPSFWVATWVVSDGARGSFGWLAGSSVAVFDVPTRSLGFNPALLAIAFFTTPSTIRLASRLARTPSVSEPLGATSTTCELGVSTRMFVVATPTVYLWLLKL